MPVVARTLAETLERGKFFIADLIEPVVGYSYGERWNGWDVPCFDRTAADEIAEQLRKQGIPVEFRSGPGGDCYVFGPDEENFPEPEYFFGFTPDPNRNPHLAGKTLFAIGACSWTWERED